jgi:hypothetical protein
MFIEIFAKFIVFFMGENTLMKYLDDLLVSFDKRITRLLRMEVFCYHINSNYDLDTIV